MPRLDEHNRTWTKNSGELDYDELRAFWHEHPSLRPAPRASTQLFMWVLFGACITSLVVWFVIPAAREFSGSRPSACEAYLNGEVAACIEEMAR